MSVRGVLGNALVLVVTVVTVSTVGSASAATGVTPAQAAHVQPVHTDGWCYGHHGDCGE